MNDDPFPKLNTLGRREGSSSKGFKWTKGLSRGVKRFQGRQTLLISKEFVLNSFFVFIHYLTVECTTPSSMMGYKSVILGATIKRNLKCLAFINDVYSFGSKEILKSKTIFCSSIEHSRVFWNSWWREDSLCLYPQWHNPFRYLGLEALEVWNTHLLLTFSGVVRSQFTAGEKSGDLEICNGNHQYTEFIWSDKSRLMNVSMQGWGRNDKKSWQHSSACYCEFRRIHICLLRVCLNLTSFWEEFEEVLTYSTAR